MQTAVNNHYVVLFFCAIGILFAWKSLATGRIAFLRGDKFSRENAPGIYWSALAFQMLFWALVASYCACDLMTECAKGLSQFFHK